MNLDTLIRETLSDWSKESQVPAGLADRALGRRTRRRFLKASATAGAAALVTGATLVAVIVGAPDTEPERPDASEALPLSRPGMNPDELSTDARSSPPKKFISAGQMSMSAYYIWRTQKISGGKTLRVQTWYLYDSVSSTYRKTPWANLDVAPGLRLAAVLEGPLPAGRVGLVNTAGGKVTRWIRLPQGGGGVSWSPDGSRLLVTHYKQNPDLSVDEVGVVVEPSSRTGYSVIDVRSGRSTFRGLPPNEDNMNVRQDLGWSRDGRLVWAPTATVPARVFYDLNGTRQPTPPHEGGDSQEAGLSPDGRHIATNTARNTQGPETAVTNIAQRVVGYQPVEQLVAWADANHLIALDCGGPTCSGMKEFRNRYSVVSIDGKKIVPLTGFRQNSQESGSWEPLFTRR